MTGIGIVTPTQALARSVRLATPKQLKAHDRATEDPRYEALIEVLGREFTYYNDRPLVVAWEDVQFASTLYQIQLWTALRSAVWSVCRTFKVVRRMAVPVGTLKKFATGSGAADKDAMLRAAERQGYVQPGAGLDDNAIDALWVALWAKSLYGTKH